MDDGSPELPDDLAEQTPDSVPEELQDFSEDVEAGSVESLRFWIQYSGDEYEVRFVREDLAEQFSDPELDELVKKLVFKGHGDPPNESALFDFGALAATMRLYDEVAVYHFPTGEWDGVILGFDRLTDSVVELTDMYVED
jgi:hypothetical protein